jgi:hypothetical protein
MTITRMFYVAIILGSVLLPKPEGTGSRGQHFLNPAHEKPFIIS